MVNKNRTWSDVYLIIISDVRLHFGDDTDELHDAPSRLLGNSFVNTLLTKYTLFFFFFALTTFKNHRRKRQSSPRTSLPQLGASVSVWDLWQINGTHKKDTDVL